MNYIKSLNVPDSVVQKKEPIIHNTCVIKDSYIGDYTSFEAFTEIFESEIGDFTYLMQNCQIQYSEVGKFCSIASYVRLHPVNHPTWRPTTHHMTYRRKSYDVGESDDDAFFDWRRGSRVVIGHDVWLGHNVTVKAGVKIGHGAVVGSCAVVTKDLPPYSIAVGNPARIVKFRFSDNEIDKLLKIKWWDWTAEEIKQRIECLNDMDRMLGEFA